MCYHDEHIGLVNIADPDQTSPKEEQSDQGLHSLHFYLHHLEASHHDRTS